MALRDFIGRVLGLPLWKRKGVWAVIVVVGLFAAAFVSSLVEERGPRRLATVGAARQAADAARQQELERARLEVERRQQAERELEEERQREAEHQRQIQAELRERARKATVDKTNRLIKDCAAVVRKGSTFSQFDAYAVGEYAESIRFFGTPAERFHFEKCMAERGMPLTTSKDKD